MTSEVDGGVVVNAYGDPDGEQWTLWCDWCVMWHRHGAGEGERAAHCMADTGSPYRAMPYALQYAGLWTAEVEAQHAAEVKRGNRARRVWSQRRGDGRAVAWRDVYAGRVGTVRSPGPVPEGPEVLIVNVLNAMKPMILERVGETSQTHVEDDGDDLARTRA